jgi:hypothetical protein
MPFVRFRASSSLRLRQQRYSSEPQSASERLRLRWNQAQLLPLRHPLVLSQDFTESQGTGDLKTPQS